MTLTQLLKKHGSMSLEQIRQFIQRDTHTLKRELQQLEICGTVKNDGDKWQYNHRQRIWREI